MFGFLRRDGPPREVSRTRYKTGLVMFAAPIIFGWDSPYFGHYLPGFESGVLIYTVAGDVLLLNSLFVLDVAFLGQAAVIVSPQRLRALPGQACHGGQAATVDPYKLCHYYMARLPTHRV